MVRDSSDAGSAEVDGTDVAGASGDRVAEVGAAPPFRVSEGAAELSITCVLASCAEELGAAALDTVASLEGLDG